MNIAIVSKLWEATKPESTGGTGAAVGYLTEELRRRGHEVTLFATNDSLSGKRLVSTISSADFRSRYSEPQELLNISAAFNRHEHFDLIHCHNEFKSLFFGAASETPSLHTVRYGEFFADEIKVFDHFKHLNFVGISQAVKNMLPSLNWQGIVYNGLDVSRFPFSAQKEDYLLFLARLSPQKGPDVAIRVARRLGKRLLLAGKRSERDAKYLREMVDPYIDGDQIRDLGEVDFSRKVSLLAKATCLLHPISCPEAFGLSLIEAMACGTPVIAYNLGAISEVLADGQTGYIVNSEDEMLEAISHLANIKPEVCRQRVEDNFTVKQMTDGYEQIYRQLIK